MRSWMTRHIATIAPSLTGGEMIQRNLGQLAKMACSTQRRSGRLPEHYCFRCSWLQTIILVQFWVRFVQQLMICGCSFAGMNDWPPGLKFRKFGARARKALEPEQFQAILVEILHERKDCRYDGTTPTEASSHCRVEGDGRGISFCCKACDFCRTSEQVSEPVVFPSSDANPKDIKKRSIRCSYTSWRNSSRHDPLGCRDRFVLVAALHIYSCPEQQRQQQYDPHRQSAFEPCLDTSKDDTATFA